MVLMMVGVFALNAWSKKSQNKRQEEQERMMKEQLVPGAWVHTRVGFFGRFVDLDGDVLILETVGGEETYWNKAVISSVGDLPFAPDEQEESDAIEEVTEPTDSEDTEQNGQSDASSNGDSNN
jgi:Preprotein translocase subunit YajC